MSIVEAPSATSTTVADGATVSVGACAVVAVGITLGVTLGEGFGAGGAGGSGVGTGAGGHGSEV